MRSNISETFIRHPHQFGSLSSLPSSNGNISSKRVIISGDFSNVKEKVEPLLERLGYTNYKYKNNINGEEAYLITLTSLWNAKDALKSISENLKLDQIQNLTVKLYEPKDERNVYVKNLPLLYSEKQLFDLFQPYGSIISKKIITKQANNNSIGFVRYTKKEEAEKAIFEINNQHLNLLGNDRLVRCEFSKTSSAASNIDSQKINNNHYSSNSVPRFRNFLSSQVASQPPQYPPNNIYYNQPIDYQLASQFSNMSLSPFIYYPNYGTNNSPLYVPFMGNYPVPYPFSIYPEINQNQNYDPNNS